MADVAASFNSRTVLVEGPMRIEPRPSAFISAVAEILMTNFEAALSFYAHRAVAE
jgi:hypothetical protein